MDRKGPKEKRTSGRPTSPAPTLLPPHPIFYLPHLTHPFIHPLPPLGDPPIYIYIYIYIYTGTHPQACRVAPNPSAASDKTLPPWVEGVAGALAVRKSLAGPIVRGGWV